jgi:hypothetical protein
MDFLRRIPLARSPALSESGRTEAPFGHTANRNLKPNANNHGRWHGVVALTKSPIRTPNKSKPGQSYPDRPRMPAYRLTYPSFRLFESVRAKKKTCQRNDFGGNNRNGTIGTKRIIIINHGPTPLASPARSWPVTFPQQIKKGALCSVGCWQVQVG